MQKFPHDRGLQKGTMAKFILVFGTVFFCCLVPCLGICVLIVIYCILSISLHLLSMGPVLNPLLLLLETWSHLIPAVFYE